jgi:hypothetical protein
LLFTAAKYNDTSQQPLKSRFITVLVIDEPVDEQEEEPEV